MVSIGLVFGGVSPEHEVSVITAMQVAAALDTSKYRPIPIYVAKDGIWYTGEDLMRLEAYKDLSTLMKNTQRVHLQSGERGRVELIADTGRKWFGRSFEPIELDVLFLALHGSEGENGAMQGLCETWNIPYTGSSVLGSALGMDKVLAKMVCRDQSIPVAPFMEIRESQWADREESWLNRIEEKLSYPVIVKPARLGSSIGIAKAKDRKELDDAIEDAFRFDEKVVVEHAVPNLREINCSVLGDPNDAVASVLEEPLTGEELLSYQEKYMRGVGNEGKMSGAKSAAPSEGMASLDRVIPAPLTEEQTSYIRQLAVKIFQLFECAGLARIDFLMEGESGQVYFNEINTIPGSFSFYLWEPSGIPFGELTHRLIDIAISRHQEKNRHIRSYDVNLLAVQRGVKGPKNT